MKKIKQRQWVQLVLIFALIFMIFNFKLYAGTAKKVKDQVGNSIDIRQDTQKKTEQWQDEKSDMAMVYDKLRYENEALEKANKLLIKQEEKHIKLNQSLANQKIENLRIQKEMLPFLMVVKHHLQSMIENDIPFLQMERKTRLKKLENIMQDIDVSIAEKFRKVMEALTIEAEYGNTIEVYQEKANIDGNEILGNVFRLGRISMFFLTFDKTRTAVFNVKENKWITLDKEYIPAIAAGVEMAAKQRSVELISLPLGKIAKQ